LSAASLWEIAIKVSLGKLALSEPFETLIPAQLEMNSIEMLGISVSHASQVAFSSPRPVRQITRFPGSDRGNPNRKRRRSAGYVWGSKIVVKKRTSAWRSFFILLNSSLAQYREKENARLGKVSPQRRPTQPRQDGC